MRPPLGSPGPPADPGDGGARSSRVAAERRALDGLQPAAQLAAARERAGYLLDRATDAAGRVGWRARRGAQLAGRGRRPRAGARLRSGRGRLASAAAALGALGPEATLARGYAIVRRVDDGAIVRDPCRDRRPGRGSGCAWPAARSLPGRRGNAMLDLAVFLGLVTLVAVAGVALGMLAAPRLAAWDDRRAAREDAAAAGARAGSAGESDGLPEGGDPGDRGNRRAR